MLVDCRNCSQRVCASAQPTTTQTHENKRTRTNRQQLDAGALDPSTACGALSGLRDAGAPLSARSADLLATMAAQGAAAAAAFVEASRGQPLGRQSSITCMETVKQSVDEVSEGSCCGCFRVAADAFAAAHRD